MGNTICKEGTSNDEDTKVNLSNRKPNWREKLSPKEWHFRFSRQPQENIAVTGERQPGDKITESENLLINGTGKTAINTANRFILLHTKHIALYKQARKSKQVSSVMKNQELSGDVK